MAEGGDKISGYDLLWRRERIKYRLWSPMAEGGDKYRVMITYG
jgi:hypothetical protein